jgi:DHA2 family multidrug resistance protein-like MFS transporter
MTATTVEGQLAGRREWLGLAVLALPTLLLSVDVSVLYLALPRLAADLHADGTQQLWIMDIYSFVLAGFLVTMGTLGDRIGRRKLLLIGGASFAAASVVAAFSRSPEMLIASRATLGVAGATLGPSTLALIRNMFPDPKQMGTAIGYWFSCFMGGLALGPLVGGILLEHFWWGSAFLLGVPFMALLLIAGPILLAEYRDPDAGRLDLVSVALSLAAILPIIYGLKELARTGAAPLPFAAIVVGLVVGITFVRRQRTLPSPLLDLHLFGYRAFSTALGTNLFLGIVMAGISYVAALYLQMVAGLSPLQAGLCLVPQYIVMTAGFMIAPRLAARFGQSNVMSVGIAISGIGLLLMTAVRSADSLGLLIGAAVLTSGGIAPAMALFVGLILGSAPPEKAGSAAALNETSGEFGIALGIATLGTLATFIYRIELSDHLALSVPSQAAAAAQQSLAAALATASQLPAAAGTDLLAAARAAFTAGLHTVGAVGGVIFLGLAALVALAFRPADTSVNARSLEDADDTRVLLPGSALLTQASETGDD